MAEGKGQTRGVTGPGACPGRGSLPPIIADARPLGLGKRDLVLADVIAAPVVGGSRPDTRVLRLLGKRALAAVQQGLAFPLLPALR